MDANTILGISAAAKKSGGEAGLGGTNDKQGKEEGEVGEEWLKDIESEWDDEVVVWFGGNG